MSTRFQARTRVPGAIWPGGATGGRPGSATGGLRLGRDATEEVALVAQAARSRLLSVHRHRLSHADLEDCYSQATIELIA